MALIGHQLAKGLERVVRLPLRNFCAVYFLK